jgi:tetratricopeptide (TPR) repeat protein
MMGIRKWCVSIPSLALLAAVAAPAQERSFEDQIREGQRSENRGDLQGAERLFQGALRQVEEQGLGLAARTVVLDNLASIDMDLGHYTDAEHRLQEALAAAKKATGADSMQSASILFHLAGMYLEMGSVDEAALLMRRVQSIAAHEGMPNSVSAAQTLLNLGVIYILQRTPDKAVQVLGKALEIFEKQSEPQGARIVQTLAFRARAYAETGQSSAAITYLERAEAMLHSLTDLQPYDLLVIYNCVGMAYARIKRPTQSEDRFNRALEIAESLFGDGHLIVAVVLKNQATALRILGRKKEAKALEARSDAILASNRTANPVGVTVNAGILGLWQPIAAR